MDVKILSDSFSNGPSPWQLAGSATIGFAISMASLWIKAWFDRRTAAKRAAMAVLAEIATNLSTLETWQKTLPVDNENPPTSEIGPSPPPLQFSALTSACNSGAFDHLAKFAVSAAARLALESLHVADTEFQYRQLFRATSKSYTGYSVTRKGLNERLLRVSPVVADALKVLRIMILKFVKHGDVKLASKTTREVMTEALRSSWAKKM